jgi:hypothetical protein
MAKKSTANAPRKTAAKPGMLGAGGRATGKESTGHMERRAACKVLVGNPDDFLFIGGIASAKDDALWLAGGDVPHVFPLGGVMGAACAMGLGLALAQPNKRVMVMTGDGELLMNSGTLATIGVLNPPNLSIIIIDNEHYGETGFQPSHTGRGVDIAKIAEGSGIQAVRTVIEESELEDAARVLRNSNGTSLVLLKCAATSPPKIPHSRNGNLQRTRFREGLGFKV